MASSYHVLWPGDYAKQGDCDLLKPAGASHTDALCEYQLRIFSGLAQCGDSVKVNGIPAPLSLLHVLS